MTLSPDLEARLTRLEEICTHQQRLLDELNEVIRRQQFELDRLTETTRRALEEVEHSIARVESPRRLEDDKPPHY